MSMTKEQYEKEFSQDPVGTVIKIHQQSLDGFKRISKSWQDSKGYQDQDLNKKIENVERSLDILKNNAHTDQVSEFNAFVQAAINDATEYLQNALKQKLSAH